MEEFGLSKYEAKAYIALLKRGALSASELAYYAGIPRTKVYGTLTKLAKKSLAVRTGEKPLIFAAAQPKEVLAGLAIEHENKASVMRNAVEDLQQICDDSRRPSGAEEQTYLVLTPDSVARTLEQLMENTKSTVACALDGWGVRLLAQSDGLAKAVARGVDARMVVAKELALDDLSLPDGATIRTGEVCANVFVFDRLSAMLVKASDGRGVMFGRADAMVGICAMMLDSIWNSAEAPEIAGHAERRK